jgi:hypothetical protein
MKRPKLVHSVERGGLRRKLPISQVQVQTCANVTSVVIDNLHPDASSCRDD